MADKRAWYSRYGVEEYLVFHPGTGLLEVFIRTPLGLSSIGTDLPWTSTVLEGCAYRVDPAPHLGDGIFDLVLRAHSSPSSNEPLGRAGARCQPGCGRPGLLSRADLADVTPPAYGRSGEGS